MAYIGKSPTGSGVRQRYYFTATGGETSLSGTDDNGLTLSYSDGAYVDVLLNGIELVAGTDYNTSTANTISGLAALAASDVVTVTVYDIFTVADTVSAKDGGTFSGNVVFNGNTTGLDLNGTELILDADADTSITADTDDQIDIKIGGSDVASFTSNGLKMVSGKGIDFSATAGTQAAGATTDSELFDDYEEGTWTPTVSTGTIGIETGSAHYIKVGRLVVAHCRIDSWSDTTSNTQIRISGLPYPTGTTQVHAGVGWTDNAIKQIFFYGGTVGNSYVDAYGGGSGYDSFRHNDLVSSNNFLITLHYITQ